jgi:hypothetical protein
MSIVYSTVNASFKDTITEDALAGLIKEGLLPDEFREHIYVFFTEVPISAIYEFMERYRVSREELRRYYKQKPRGDVDD